MGSDWQVAGVASSILSFIAVFLGARWVGPAWDALSRRYVADLTPRLRALGMDEAGMQQYLRWWGLVMFGAFVVIGILLQMVLVAIGVLYLILIAPRFLLDRQIARRRIVLRDQLVRATVALANSARSGMSMPQAVEAVGKDMADPLAAEFRRMSREYHQGRPLAESLKAVQRRLDLESFTIFSSAILVAMEHGGRITFALERISGGLQELQRLERRLEADTAAGRKLALVLGMFPIIFLIGFSFLDPASTSFLYNTVIGQIVLVGVGVLIFLSMKWCQKILSIEF